MSDIAFQFRINGNLILLLKIVTARTKRDHWVPGLHSHQ